MSSDSEDEDELLQMALKEQAQRDVSYGKSSASSNSRKPVANYVQPPSSQPRKAAPVGNSSGGRPMQGKGSSGARKVEDDDDDDSEVEMLSISSGDEDSTKDRNVGSRKRGGASAAAGAGEQDDDRAWDGGEPDKWKFVDEAEVCDDSGFIYVLIFYWTKFPAFKF